MQNRRYLSYAFDLARSFAAPAMFAAAIAAVLPACSAVPRGSGSYMVTVLDASSGRPVEGIALVATGAGARMSGVKPATATTDEDGVAVLRFGDWGSVDLVLEQGASTERWMVTQDRIAVNGGTASREPMRLMVGSRSNGGASAYGVRITRIEKGGRVDN